MKKTISLLTIFILLASCSNDVKFNDPGFQVYKNNTLIKPTNVVAYKSVSTGVVSIQASTDVENISMLITNSYVGSYYLGTSNSNTLATYNSVSNGVIYNYSTTPKRGSINRISSIVTPGSGYTSSSAAQTTTTGGGTGLVVLTTASNGIVTSAKIVTPGNNYFPGDLVTINGGNNQASFYVENTVGTNGVITITDSSNGTISGSFKFNALNTDTSLTSPDVLNFTNGAFYKIPLISMP